MLPDTSLSRIWNLAPTTLADLRREFDSAFESVSGAVSRNIHRLPMSIWEDDARVVVEFDVPGFLREDLEVTVENGVLTLVAKRVAPVRVGEVRHTEHQYGEFKRTLKLNDSLDPSAVTAELENGVLALTILKRAEAQPLKIPVEIKSNRDSDSEE